MRHSYHRMLTLDNGLRVLLESSCPDDINDEDNPPGERHEEEEEEREDSGHSAVSLCVSVGTFDDPPELPGLAHLLEHVVFLGSYKFPEFTGFDSLVKNEEGGNNGQTFFERTVYVFSVRNRSFSLALEQFADMFYSPLLEEKGVKHEINMVDSEWSLRRREDKFCHEHLLTTMAKQDHPLSRFSWGNYKSLSAVPTKNGLDVRKSLREFFERHYVAERMSLVIMSNKSLEELETLARKFFSCIPRRRDETAENPSGSGANERNDSPFDMEKFNKYYRVSAEYHTHSVYVTWALPAQIQTLCRERPLYLLSYLLGHEGPGSLCSLLIKKRLATHVTACDVNPDVSCTAVTIYSIVITLTSVGLDKLWEVVKYLFHYIHIVKGAGAEKLYEIWNDMKELDDLSDRYRCEDINTEEHVKALALAMHQYNDTESVLNQGQPKFDYSLIMDCLNLLTAEAMNIVVISPSFKPTEQSKFDEWFLIHYSDDPIPKKLMTELKTVPTTGSEFQLPGMPQYFPMCFEVKKRSESERLGCKGLSTFVNDTYQNILYYNNDPELDDPKTYMYLYFKDEVINVTPFSSCTADIYIRVLELELNDVIYEAEFALITCSFEVRDNGIFIVFRGFTDTLQEFIHMVIDKISTIRIDSPLFRMASESVRTNYMNTISAPESLGNEIRESVLRRQYHTSVSKLSQIQQIGLEDVTDFARVFYKRCALECMMHGNLDSCNACEYAAFVVKTLHIQTGNADQVGKRSMHLVNRMPCYDVTYREKNHHPNDENTAVQNCYLAFNSEEEDTRNDVCNEMVVRLLSIMIEEPCETFLRTRNGLGYQIQVSELNDAPMFGLRILVQSQASRFSSQSIDAYVELFIQEFICKHILPMTNDYFRQIVALVRGALGSPDARSKWQEILQGTNNYYKQDQQVEYLDDLRKDDFQEMAVDLLLNKPGLRRKLSVQVNGHKKESVGGCALNKPGDNEVKPPVKKHRPV